MYARIREYTSATTYPRHQRVIVGLLLVGITLVGISAYGNWFSFLMLLCVGMPSLLLLIETLTDE